MATLFINYRYIADAGMAQWIASELATRFGHDRVFVDNQSLQLGDDYQKEIPRQLYGSNAVLVIIGPQWLNVRDASGRRALDHPKDWVRREIATALSIGVPVIPVLVQGARLPRSKDLPVDLRPLVTRRGINVDQHSGRHDIDALVQRLSEQFSQLKTATSQPPPTAQITKKGQNRIRNFFRIDHAEGRTKIISHQGDKRINISFGTAGLAILGIALLSGATATVIVNYHPKPSVTLSSIVGKWEQQGANMGVLASTSPGILTVSADGHFRFTESISEFPGFMSPQTSAGSGKPNLGFGEQVDCSGSVEPSDDHFIFHSTSAACSDFNATTADNGTVLDVVSPDGQGSAESLARTH